MAVVVVVAMVIVGAVMMVMDSEVAEVVDSLVVVISRPLPAPCVPCGRVRSARAMMTALVASFRMVAVVMVGITMHHGVDGFGSGSVRGSFGTQSDGSGGLSPYAVPQDLSALSSGSVLLDKYKSAKLDFRALEKVRKDATAAPEDKYRLYLRSRGHPHLAKFHGHININ